MATKKTTPARTANYKDLYLDERFNGVNTKLDELKDMLISKASSSSVLRLEERVKEIEQSHIPCGSLMLVQKQVGELEKKFSIIESATDGAVYFTKHPTQFRLFIIGVIVFLFISAVGLIPSWMMWKKFKQEEFMVLHQTEKVKTEPTNQITK